MCITIFILFINLLNAPRVDALTLYEGCDTPSMIGAFYSMAIIYESAGTRYGKLTILSFSHKHSKNNGLMYNCICDCGKIKTVLGTSMRSGNSRSCGCNKTLHRIKHGESKHGNKSAEYNIWCGIKARCGNIKNPQYFNYGGRGVIICDRWKNSFENFITDMGKRPSIKHSIDRINMNGNYEPSNCRWATDKEQCNNTRRNRILIYNGESLNITQWAEKLGLRRGIISHRIHRGWDIRDALTRKPQIKTKNGRY